MPGIIFMQSDRGAWTEKFWVLIRMQGGVGMLNVNEVIFQRLVVLSKL